MARRETSTDFRDSKQFDISITKSGNVVSLEITTESSKEEWVLDMADFVALIAEGSLISNKKRGAA